jgi:hypothetical protein
VEGLIGRREHKGKRKRVKQKAQQLTVLAAVLEQ